MRIVMPLFNFHYFDNKEFEFGDGTLSLRNFKADDEIPEVPWLSDDDKKYIKKEYWALVYDNQESNKDNEKLTYKEKTNILLLTFKIYTSSRLFIKYRLCRENPNFTKITTETMGYNPVNKNDTTISYNDLEVINEGFKKLLKMFAISNRTNNALYFLFKGYLASRYLESFILLMCALESLFSDEKKRGATKTICSRVSKFLNSKEKCEYKDIYELYDLPSDMVHGRIVINDEPEQNLKQLHRLEYVVKECMKKMLTDKVYKIYDNVEKKEAYYKKLVKSN